MQYPYKPPFEAILPATFVERPNRFIVHARLESGETVRTFLPNPGRLRELLLPEVTVYLVPEPPDSKRKTKFTMVGVAGEEAPIFLHTHVNNDVARHLLAHGLVPGLEGATIVRSEVPLGHSRFDFLLEHDGEPVYVEVKSCTLFGNGVAMFPDAITERGRRHLEELAELADGGTRTVVLFVVHSGAVQWFMPDFHTDLAFSKTLLAVRDRVSVLPMAVGWSEQFQVNTPPRLLPIPWEYIERETHDRGNWLILCHVGTHAKWPAGYYLIAGWCADELMGRLKKYLGRGKGLGALAEHAFQQSEERVTFPIVSSANSVEAILAALDAMPDWEAPPTLPVDFGEQPIRYTREDPTKARSFHAFLARFRMAAP